MADATQTTPGGQTPSQPMEGGSPGSPAANVAPSPSAQQTVPSFGGIRGGRVRRDGLIPGSPEALAEDRRKDRERKRRARQKPADPAPIPSQGGSGPAHKTPTVETVAGSALPGPDSLPGPSQPVGLAPWKDEDLKPIFDQLLPTFEELSCGQIISRAEKASLPAELVRDIGKDARWPKVARQSLDMGCPMLAAKYLNKSGISSENKPEVLVGTAVATILAGHMLLLSKLDKLIAERNPPEIASKGKGEK